MTRINLIPPEDLLDGKYIVGPRAYKEIKDATFLDNMSTGLGGYVDEATRAKLETEYRGIWPELAEVTKLWNLTPARDNA